MPVKKKLQIRRAKQKESRRRRTLIEESVRTHLIPALLKRGFDVGPPLKLPEPIDRDYLASFPAWAQFVRDRGSAVDDVDIQFASYERAAFRIKASAVPKDVTATAAGQADGPHDRFETHARRWLRPMVRALRLEPLGGWFSLWRLPLGSPTPADYDKLALRAAAILPELELALREGRLGPHMRRFEMKLLPPEVLERMNERISKLKAEGKWTTDA